jgi:hypothetical protein
LASIGSASSPLTRETTGDVSEVPGTVTLTVAPATVAQTHGCICGPEKIGPPFEWLVIVRLAYGRPLPLPFASATKRFGPSTSPVSRPTKRRSSAWYWNCDDTSWPFRLSAS